MILSETWRQKAVSLARHIATWSKDPATKVGCVLFGADHEILSTGYNGLPRSVQDLAWRMDRPAKYLWTAHAEANAVAQAARTGACLKGATAVVTHPPCARCAGLLVQAGIKTVIHAGGTTNMPEEEFAVADTIFDEADVLVIGHKET